MPHKNEETKAIKCESLNRNRVKANTLFWHIDISSCHKYALS